MQPRNFTLAASIGDSRWGPEGSRVRYKKEYGYITESDAFGYVGPTSCGAFSVSVIAGDGSAQRLSPSRISGSDSKMVDYQKSRVQAVREL